MSARDDAPLEALRGAEEVASELLAKALERGNIDAALKCGKELRLVQAAIAERLEGAAAAAIADPVERLRAHIRIAAAKGSAGPVAQMERDLRDLLREQEADRARAAELAELATTPDDAIEELYRSLCEELAPHVRRKLGARLIASAPTLAERQATAAGPQ
jgi:uncharacterized protein YicC (UPF0701 family)